MGLSGEVPRWYSWHQAPSGRLKKTGSTTCGCGDPGTYPTYVTQDRSPGGFATSQSPVIETIFSGSSNRRTSPLFGMQDGFVGGSATLVQLAPGAIGSAQKDGLDNLRVRRPRHIPHVCNPGPVSRGLCDVPESRNRNDLLRLVKQEDVVLRYVIPTHSRTGVLSFEREPAFVARPCRAEPVADAQD